MKEKTDLKPCTFSRTRDACVLIAPSVSASERLASSVRLLFERLDVWTRARACANFKSCSSILFATTTTTTTTTIAKVNLLLGSDDSKQMNQYIYIYVCIYICECVYVPMMERAGRAIESTWEKKAEGFLSGRHWKTDWWVAALLPAPLTNSPTTIVRCVDAGTQRPSHTSRSALRASPEKKWNALQSSIYFSFPWRNLISGFRGDSASCFVSSRLYFNSFIDRFVYF